MWDDGWQTVEKRRSATSRQQENGDAAPSSIPS